jgi:hypothetical protein
MNPTRTPFPLGRCATATIVGCFLVSCLLANVLHAESSATNSVPVWPFTPPADLKPPSVRHADRVTNGIDNFILARLEEKGLTLAPAASARTLVRRLYFDLIGLPPSPAEEDAFVNDSDPKAYHKLVDKLVVDSRLGKRDRGKIEELMSGLVCCLFKLPFSIRLQSTCDKSFQNAPGDHVRDDRDARACACRVGEGGLQSRHPADPLGPVLLLPWAG